MLIFINSDGVYKVRLPMGEHRALQFVESNVDTGRNVQCQRVSPMPVTS